jgi:RHS repeat-associated protein
MLRNENRHYVQVPGATVVIKTLNATTSGAALNGYFGGVDVDDFTYWHKDALGTVVAVTNNVGGPLQERRSYDAWGRRLRMDGAVDTTWAPMGDRRRGYTGHEQLDELGLVHMNARLYDPVLARFLGADPINAAPDMLQNYNAYSYALNNPVRFNDPSGECPVCFMAAAFVGGVMAMEGNKYWRVVGTLIMAAAGPYALAEVGIGTAVGTAGHVAGSAASLANSAATAALIATVQPNATPESVLTSALFAGAFTAAGANFKGDWVQLLAAHALLGCAQGAVSGGECGPSALAAVAGKGATLGGEYLDLGPVSMGLLTAIAGGTAAKIGGGKFGNGAAQAAFGYIFIDPAFVLLKVAGAPSCGGDASHRHEKLVARSAAREARASDPVAQGRSYLRPDRRADRAQPHGRVRHLQASR